MTQSTGASEALDNPDPIAPRGWLAARSGGRHRRHPVGGGPDRRVAVRILSLRAGCADRVGGRCRARTDGGDGLLRRGQCACPQRERRRRLLRAETGTASPPARRRHCGVGCLDGGRVGRVVRHCAGPVHHRPDDRLRLAAGTDIFPDGRGRAVHDDIRACPVLSPQAVRHRVRRHLRAGFGRSGVWLAVHRPRRGAFGSANAPGFRGEPGRRRADRICARVHRAHLHLDRRRPARPHFRATNGARHRQFRAARDPVLHPGRLFDGGERHVRPPDRAARTPGRTGARRAQRRDGAVDGDLLRHLRLEDGRCRGCWLGADPGGAPVAPKSWRRGGVARGFRRHGRDHPAVHQPDHTRLRRQSFDRRAVHGGIVAGRSHGARAYRRRHPAWRRRAIARRGSAQSTPRWGNCGAAQSLRSDCW